jgi:hypothetical protein
MDGSLPASIKPEVKRLLKLLRVHKVKADKDHDPDEGWNDPWYRIEAGLPIRAVDLSGLFGHLISPARRIPMPPRAWHLRPGPSIQDAVLLRQAAQLRATTANPAAFAEACKRAKRLPKRSGSSLPTHLSRSAEERGGEWFLGLHKGELFLLTVSPRGGELLNRSAVELNANFRPARVEDVVAFTLEPMLRLGLRPGNVVVAQPSLCSMLDVQLYEEAYAALGIVVNMASYDDIELNFLPQVAREPWSRPAAQAAEGSCQSPQASQARPAGLATPSASEQVFAEGQRVRVLGLVARPELNGLCGTTGRFLADSGRWEVHLVSGGSSTVVKSMVVNVKPVNLEEVAPS